MEDKKDNSNPAQETSDDAITSEPSANDGDKRSNSENTNNSETNKQNASPTKIEESMNNNQVTKVDGQANDGDERSNSDNANSAENNQPIKLSTKIVEATSKVDGQEHDDTERKRKRKHAGLMVSFGKVSEIPPQEFPPEEPAEEKTADEEPVDEGPEDEQDEAYNPDEDDEDSEQDEETDSTPLDLPQGLIANLLSQGTLGSKPLHAAAATGDVGELKELIKEDGEMHGKVNDVDIFYYTALHVASEHGHADCCEMLIKSGVDIEARTKLHESTALHYGTFPFPKFCCS